MTTQYTSNPILPAAGVRRSSAAGQGPGPHGHHDDGYLNPGHHLGRDQSDFRTKATAPFLKCKKLLTISSAPFEKSQGLLNWQGVVGDTGSMYWASRGIAMYIKTKRSNFAR